MSRFNDDISLWNVSGDSRMKGMFGGFYQSLPNGDAQGLRTCIKFLVMPIPLIRTLPIGTFQVSRAWNKCQQHKLTIRVVVAMKSRNELLHDDSSIPRLALLVDDHGIDEGRVLHCNGKSSHWVVGTKGRDISRTKRPEISQTKSSFQSYNFNNQKISSLAQT